MNTEAWARVIAICLLSAYSWLAVVGFPLLVWRLLIR